MLSRYTTIVGARNQGELLAATVDFAEQLGFRTATAMLAIDHPNRATEFFAVDNAPSASRSLVDDLERARRDPVMQHCKRSSVPIIWDQSTYVAGGQANLWEEQAAYGYATGITVASHLPGGRHVCIGVDRDRRLPRSEQTVARMVADLVLFAAHALEVAQCLLAPELPEQIDQRLTARELECFRWTMEGKTAWEVGSILGISEQTAVRHLNNGTQKLNCVNKHHAVIKALRLGLIR
jgi:DNA-binding CsgD family transcriptional regulator